MLINYELPHNSNVLLKSKEMASRSRMQVHEH